MAFLSIKQQLKAMIGFFLMRITNLYELLKSSASEEIDRMPVLSQHVG